MSVLNDGSLAAFLRACGARQPLHLLLRNRQTGETTKIQLRYPFAVVGRHVRSDLPIPDWRVSSRHAYLQVFNGAVFCADLGSKTGLVWRSGRHGANWFVPGDALVLGNYELELYGPSARLVVDEAQPPVSPLRKPPDPDLRPAAWLEFLTGKSPERYWRVTRPMVLLGRAPWCKLQLSHRTVSTAHCVLLWQAGNLWLVDLNSRSGILVNDLPQRWARLNDGDIFSLGVFSIRCHYAAPDDVDHQQPTASVPEPHTVDDMADQQRATGIEVSERDTDTLPPFSGPALAARPAARSSAQDDRVPVSAHTDPPARLLIRSGSDEEAGLMVRPEGGDVPVTLTRNDLSWLVDQMAAFQQQVFDQSQQLVLMVLQAFGRMHNEQMAVIKKELDALKEINRELVWLKARLAQARQPDSTPTGQTVRREATTRVTTAIRVTPGPNGTGTPPGAAAPSGAKSQPAPPPASSSVETSLSQPGHAEPLPRGAQAAAPKAANESKAERRKRKVRRAPAAFEKRSRETAATEDSPAGWHASEPPGASDVEAADIHAWLCQRMAELQQEQASRWQRIMELLGTPFGAGRGLP